MEKRARNPILLGLFLVLFFSILAMAFYTYKTRPIFIGFSGNLSGRNSEIGVDARNGAFLAVNEVNDDGGINGRTLFMQVADDAFSNDGAAKADAQLLKNGCLAIIGHLTSNTGMAVKDNYRSGEYLYLSPLISTDTLTGADDYFFRVVGSNRYQGELLADYAINIDKIKRIAIVYEDTNSSYTKQLVDFSAQYILEKGGSIVKSVSFVSNNSKDLQTTARDIMSSAPQGVIIVSSGMDTAILCQNLKRLDSTVRLYAGTYATTADLFSLGGPAVEGLAAVTIYSTEDFDGPLKSFTQKYTATYNKQPDFAAANAYIAVKTIAKAMKSADDFTPDGLKKALLAEKNYDGLNATFSFDEFGDVSRPYCLIKVVNGQFRKVR